MIVPAWIERYWQNYVNGAWADGGGGKIAVDDPATGMVLAHLALADSDDVNRAVEAAKACHDSGSLTAMRPVHRGRMVRGMGDNLLANIDHIAYVLSRKEGRPPWEARIEVEGTARYFEYMGIRPKP